LGKRGAERIVDEEEEAWDDSIERTHPYEMNKKPPARKDVTRKRTLRKGGIKRKKKRIKLKRERKSEKVGQKFWLPLGGHS